MDIDTLDTVIAHYNAELYDVAGRIDSGATGTKAAQLRMRMEFLHGYLAALRHTRYAMANPEWDMVAALSPCPV